MNWLQTFLRDFCNLMKDPAWWAENTLSLLIFSLMVSWLVGFMARRLKDKERAPFTDWSVEVVDGERKDTASLAWDEVRRFHASPLEERRFIQSAVSSRGERMKINRLNVLKGADWVKRDNTVRKYMICMDKFRISQDCEK